MTNKRPSKRLIKRNIGVLAAVSFFIYLLPYTPVAVIIFEKLSGSYVQAMSVFSLMSLTAAFLEIPTGFISDKWGRKTTLSVGCFLSFLNVVCLAFALRSAHSLWFLYMAALCQGAAEAFYSGNNEALIYETLVSLKRSHAFPKVIGRMKAMTQGGLAFSGLLGSLILLGGVSYDALIYASLLTSLVLVALSLSIVEPPERAFPDSRPMAHIATAFKLIKTNEKLRLYSLINMFQMGSSNTNYYFTPGFIGSVWSAWAAPVFRAGQHTMGLLGFWNSGRVIKRFGVLRTLIGAPYLANGLLLAAYWIANVFSPFILIIAQPFFACWQTAKSSFEQDSFSKQQRATMGSLINLGGSIVTAALCLIVGWLADHISLSMTMFITIAVSAIIINGNYAAIYRRHK